MLHLTAHRGFAVLNILVPINCVVRYMRQFSGTAVHAVIYFQNSMSDLRPFEVQLDEVTPKLFMAHAVGLSFAGLETQYSAWLDLFCLRHYSNKIYKDGAVFQDISVLPVLEDDIKAIRSCTASNHNSKKADGEGSSNKNPTAKAAQNADILVYRSAEMTTVQIKINIIF